MFTQHVVVNVAKLVAVRKDAKLAESIRSCDIINIDGMGLVWAGRWLGFSIPERVAGIDLFARLLDMAANSGYPIFLLGAKPEVVARVAAVVRAKYPRLQIAGTHHGYFDDEESVVKQIAGSGARLLFVAMTSPKKEQFIDRYGKGLGIDFVMGVGGTFDVVAGKVRRAPRWMQKGGLEWLYRVYQEPRRMWRRYLVSNLAFCRIVLSELTKSVGR